MIDNLIVKILIGLNDDQLDKIGTEAQDDLFDNEQQDIKDAYMRATGNTLSNIDAQRAEKAMEEFQNEALFPKTQVDLMVANVKTRNELGQSSRLLGKNLLGAQAGVKKMETSVEDQHENITRLENTLLGYTAATFNNYMYSFLIGLILLTLVIVPGLEYVVSRYVLNRQPVITGILQTDYTYVAVILGVFLLYRLMRGFSGDKGLMTIMNDALHNLWSTFAKGVGRVKIALE